MGDSTRLERPKHQRIATCKGQPRVPTGRLLAPDRVNDVLPGENLLDAQARPVALSIISAATTSSGTQEED